MRNCVLLLLVLVGCAASRTGRTSTSARNGIERARHRTGHLGMVDEEAARATMKDYRGRRVPHLARVAAQMPETWRAEMDAWHALGKEGTLDRPLLAAVFYVVSSANDCFY